MAKVLDNLITTQPYKGAAHNGIDLRARTPLDIYALTSGKVVRRFYDKWGGNQLLIFHPSLNLYAGYAHLSKMDVSVGQQVSAGQRLGLTGNTGYLGGNTSKPLVPHLHFSMSRTEKFLQTHIDPTPYIAYQDAPQYNFTAKQVLLKVTGTSNGLRVRRSPNTASDVVDKIAENGQAQAEGYTTNGQPINGNAVWYKLGEGRWVAQAFTNEVAPPAPTPAPTPEPPKPTPTIPVPSPTTPEFPPEPLTDPRLAVPPTEPKPKPQPMPLPPIQPNPSKAPKGLLWMLPLIGFLIWLLSLIG